MSVGKTAEAEQDRKQTSELKSRLLGPSVNVGLPTSSRNLPFLSRIDRFGRVSTPFFSTDWLERRSIDTCEHALE
jgi:hypothetical protein